MSLAARPESPGSAFRVVGELDELVAFTAAHPREIVVLREAAPPSPERLRAYARRLGGVVEARGYGEVRSVRYDPSVAASTAMSLRALAFHTDGSFLEKPPRRFLLSCVRDDQGGRGVSRFYPLGQLLDAMPGWVIAALRAGAYRFPQTYDGDTTSSWVAPVLSSADDGSPRIRWRSDELFRPPVVASRDPRAAAAVKWLHEHLASRTPVTYLARRGETLLVPNESVLHGRTALTAGSQRELLRVWVA